MSLFRRTARSLTPSLTRISFIQINSQCPSRLDTCLSTPCNDKCISGRRSIHVSSTIGDIVRVTADSLSTVHDAGVPWYITIPLLAVGVNFTFRLPLQYYSRKISAKRLELNPLLTAWISRHGAHLARTQPEVPESKRSLQVAGATEKSRRRIYKAWGTQRWKNLAPFLGMFPFVVISEALRRKCGAPLGWISHQIGLGSATGMSDAATDMVDSSLVNGGLLWFTDLTAMDPYFSLPILCSSILAYSTWGQMPKEQLRELLSRNAPNATFMSKIGKTLRRILLMIPVFPLLFADLPSAVFLYWASSFALTNLNGFIVGRFIPRKPPTLHAEPKISKVRPYLIGKKEDV